MTGLPGLKLRQNTDPRLLRERIIILEAQKSAIWDQYQAAVTSIATLENYQTKAFSILEIYGVPKERARYVANGIEVLATRHRREVQDLAHTQKVLEGDFAEAIDIILMTGVAPKFVEKHK